MIDSTLVGLVSAATVLVASIAAPLVTLRMGRLQIRASVLSANRQKWIDSFREAVATFLSQVAAIVHLREKIVSGGSIHVSAEPEVLKRFEALVFTLARIRLLVDPLDEQQRQMLAVMQQQLKKLQSAATDADIVADNESTGFQVVELAVGILRKEWARVKRLD